MLECDGELCGFGRAEARQPTSEDVSSSGNDLVELITEPQEP